MRLRFAQHFLHALLDSAIPQTCCACGRWIPGELGRFCPTCALDLATGLAMPYCPRCAHSAPLTALDADGCPHCRGDHIWNAASMVRLGPYAGALKQLILGLKYAGAQRNAEWLTQRLAEALTARGYAREISAFVPVPMHWRRRWQRPVDHARLLAELLARRLGVPCRRLVRRRMDRPSQTTQPSMHARFENVRDCFELRRSTGWSWPLPRQANAGMPAEVGAPRPARSLRGQTVCIVDNLIVSGATIHEMAKVLRAAGAARIFVAVLARSELRAAALLEAAAEGE